MEMEQILIEQITQLIKVNVRTEKKVDQMSDFIKENSFSGSEKNILEAKISELTQDKENLVNEISSIKKDIEESIKVHKAEVEKIKTDFMLEKEQAIADALAKKALDEKEILSTFAQAWEEAEKEISQPK